MLLNSKLPMDILGRIWDLSDIDKDGYLDREEFSVVGISRTAHCTNCIHIGRGDYRGQFYYCNSIAIVENTIAIVLR